ncbi:hypothetical protein KFE25_009753 [Diacronema lutheri]|nr:hypothetical protein KFE25_009753 [Diacronema lutheri]
MALFAAGEGVGTALLREDAFAKIWEFTLEPGEQTGVHVHEYDYHFAVVSPSTLRVFAANGTVLFDFEARGTFGLRLLGGELVPIVGELPAALPAAHAVKNVGSTAYREILFESKVSTNATWPRPPGLPERARRLLRSLGDALRSLGQGPAATAGRKAEL